MRHGCLAAMCAALLAAAVVAPAQAADSLAPPGAPRNWLPKDDWVQNHWLPYDEDALFAALRMSREDVRDYFQGDALERVPPLADVARRRGLVPRELARKLVTQWRPATAPEFDDLVDRALRTLTQGHLMQHMLFHPLHDRALFQATPDVFGVSTERLAVLLGKGLSRRDIGHRQGRSDAQMQWGAKSVLKVAQDSAVGTKATPAVEAVKELADQVTALPDWLDFRGADAIDPQAVESSRSVRSVASVAMLCPLVAG